MDLIAKVADEVEVEGIVAGVAPLVTKLIDDVIDTIETSTPANNVHPAQVRGLQHVLKDLQMADPSTEKPTPENATMMQAFEWYVPADHQHWDRLTSQIPQLKAFGIDNLWIPPGCKAGSDQSNGYDIYDLYDLGEFDQKGSKGTKWGTKAQLETMLAKAKEAGVGIYWDAVLNHKASADHKEICSAQEVDDEDRTKTITDPYDIDAWLGFDFPGRGEKYSKQKYHWYHFTGTDFDAKSGRTATFKILGDDGKGWADSGDVDGEKGNFDYLMYADLDYAHPEVKQDVINWGAWMAKEIGITGMRFDAIKHFSVDFLAEFIEKMDEAKDGGWFFVGEFWKDSLDDMSKYLDRMGHKFSLFDAPLVYNFSELSKTEGGDLRGVFDGTLVRKEPIAAVTLVMNHDTQPYQALEAAVEPFFKPLAYALILLRYDGYPCVWYGDVYGVDPNGEKQSFPPAAGGKIPHLALARKLYAYGLQKDYFDEANCVGWVRYGTWDRRFGCATVISNAGPGTKRMHVGEMHQGEVWTDVLGWSTNEVVIGDDGCGEFTCPGVSVSVWVNRDAEGRERFLEEFDSDIYKKDEKKAEDSEKKDEKKEEKSEEKEQKTEKKDENKDEEKDQESEKKDEKDQKKEKKEEKK